MLVLVPDRSVDDRLGHQRDADGGDHAEDGHEDHRDPAGPVREQVGQQPRQIGPPLAAGAAAQRSQAAPDPPSPAHRVHLSSVQTTLPVSTPERQHDTRPRHSDAGMPGQPARSRQICAESAKPPACRPANRTLNGGRVQSGQTTPKYPGTPAAATRYSGLSGSGRRSPPCRWPSPDTPASRGRRPGSSPGTWPGSTDGQRRETLLHRDAPPGLLGLLPEQRDGVRQ